MDAGKDYRANFLKALEEIDVMPEDAAGGAGDDPLIEVPLGSGPTDQAPAVEESTVQPPAAVGSSAQPSVAAESADQCVERPLAVLSATAGGTGASDPPEEKQSKRPKASASSEMEKSSKRRKTSASDKEKDMPAARHTEAGFVEDKMACAKALYELRHPETSGEVPPLDDLLEIETYRRYARNEMKNQALLNKMVIDYQRRSQMARNILVEADQMKTLNYRLNERLEAKKAEADSLRADLAAKAKELAEAKSVLEQQSAVMKRVADSRQRAMVEIRSLGEYSQEVRARADRLRERLVYLGKVETPTRMAGEVRTMLDCMNSLKPRVRFAAGRFEQLEADAKRFEAEVEAVPPFELRDEELAPLGAYVTVCDEFERLLEFRVPPEHAAQGVSNEGSQEARVSTAAQVNEEDLAGGDDAQAD